MLTRTLITSSLLAAFAAAVPLATASRPSPQDAKPTVAVTGGTDDPAVREKTLAIAQDAWKQACVLFDVEPAPRGRPVEIHLDRDIAEYELACDRLCQGRFKENQAFSEPKGFMAHIAMQPPLKNDALKQFAPTFQTLRLVAHEMSHLVRYAKFPNHASHPAWLVDGAASWIETRVLTAAGLMKVPEEVPVFSTHAVRVQRLLEQKKLPSVDDLIHDRIELLDMQERYALRYLFFRFLVERIEEKPFHQLRNDIRRFGGGDDYVDKLADAVKEHYGAEPWKNIDATFQTFIKGLKPDWEEELRQLTVNADEWTQCAFDDANAIAFRTTKVGPKRYAIEGTVTTIADRAESSQANVLLGRIELDGGNRFTSVAFVPGDSVTLLEFDPRKPEDQRWKSVATEKLPNTAVGKAIAFDIECEPGKGRTRVAVKCNGKLVLKGGVDGMLDGAWGVGAQKGCSCIWRSCRVTPR